MRLRVSAVFTLALLLLFLWAVGEAGRWEWGRWVQLDFARGWRVQARLFPWIIGIPMALLTAVQLVQELWGRKKAAAAGATGAMAYAALVEEHAEPVEPGEERRRTVNIVAWILGFVAAIWLLGWPIGVSLSTLLYLKLARESWAMSAAITVGTWLSFYLLFDCTVHVPLGEGVLLGGFSNPAPPCPDQLLRLLAG